METQIAVLSALSSVIVARMKSPILLILALVAYSSTQTASPAQQPAWHENIDITSLLSNKRVWVPYMKCLLDQGKCSMGGKELKSAFKEALGNHCEKCTEVQRAEARKLIAYFIEKEPEIWRLLVEKYDPKKEYLTRIEEDLKKHRN